MSTVAKQARIDVKQAVKAAKEFVREVYSEEKIFDLGLEEVNSDGDVWLVTIGFSRPWNMPKVQQTELVAASLLPLLPRAEPAPKRDYKVVKIDAFTGESLGMGVRGE